MSVYELLSLAVSALGFLGVIISIMFLRQQTREATKQSKTLAESLKASAFQLSASLTADADKIFIEHPEMRPYFYSGKPVAPEDPNYELACAISEYILDLYASVLRQNLELAKVWADPYWKTVMAQTFARSPILCERLTAQQTWYEPILLDIMHASVGETVSVKR